jgi:hypothetical protein
VKGVFLHQRGIVRLARVVVDLITPALTAWTGILYLSLPLEDPKVSPETSLQPYLRATLALTKDDQPIEPLFSLYYTQMEPSPATPEDRCLVPQITTLISECADSAAAVAEDLFKKTVSALDDIRRERGTQISGDLTPFWPPLEDEGNNDELDW